MRGGALLIAALGIIDTTGTQSSIDTVVMADCTVPPRPVQICSYLLSFDYIFLFLPNELDGGGHVVLCLLGNLLISTKADVVYKHHTGRCSSKVQD